MSSTVDAPDILAAIVAATERSVEVRAAALPLAELERRAAGVATRPMAFKSAVSAADRINVIAECKRRSPSRGVLRADYDPAVIARGYTEAGAAAISVLTEATFFDGSLEHLAAVRDTTDRPLIRKDFIVTRYQVVESKAAGADAILLIVAALTPPVLKELHAAATDAGLGVLVEVHALPEIETALAAGAEVIGVNNRDLRTLAVDTEISERAVDFIPEHVVAIAESGLKSGADLLRLRAAGYDAFLIGERLMAAQDPARALAELLKDARA